MSWVAIAIGGSALLGAGASIYGANKQSQANSSANDANVAAQNKQNDSAWQNWLMSKGLASNTPLTAGTMPTASQGYAVNTRLPLWATMPVQTTSRWTKGGTQNANAIPSSTMGGYAGTSSGMQSVSSMPTGSTYSGSPSVNIAQRSPVIPYQYPFIPQQSQFG